MRQFLYLEQKTHAPVIVFAKKKPSEKTIPRNGAWVLTEWTGKKWSLPCFAQITWGTLKKQLTFIGEVKIEVL